MTDAVINTRFLFELERSVLRANESLGVSPQHPNGTVPTETEDLALELHTASVELLRSIEGLQNWAADVTRALRELGVEVDNG